MNKKLHFDFIFTVLRNSTLHLQAGNMPETMAGLTKASTLESKTSGTSFTNSESFQENS